MIIKESKTTAERYAENSWDWTWTCQLDEWEGRLRRFWHVEYKGHTYFRHCYDIVWLCL